MINNEIDQGQLCLDCESKCKGFEAHSWRNICKNCKCLRESHDIRFRGYVTAQERLQLDAEMMHRFNVDNKKFAALEKGFAWQPAGLSSQDIDLFFEQYPPDFVPKLGTYGEKWREQALMHQMPKQDISTDFCKFVIGEQAERRYKEFIEQRNTKALDIGICYKNIDSNLKCKYCNDLIELGSIYVHASAFNTEESLEKNKSHHDEEDIENEIESNVFHSACFRCTLCDDLLVDLVYCMKNSKLYCVRHYGETCKPRCFSCDEKVCRAYFLRSFFMCPGMPISCI